MAYQSLVLTQTLLEASASQGLDRPSDIALDTWQQRYLALDHARRGVNACHDFPTS